jgi:protein TonB
VPPPPAPAPETQPALTLNPDAAPPQAPSVINLDPPPAPPRVSRLSDAISAVPGGMPHGTSGGFVGLPAPPPAPAPQATGPVRPGGDVDPPTKIRDARPVYPAIAIAAKVEGAVIIEAILTREGTVRDARVLRSVPLLDQAALDAVRQWRYTPTTLNGVPVEVIMTVTVVFTLR